MMGGIDSSGAASVSFCFSLVSGDLIFTYRKDSFASYNNVVICSQFIMNEDQQKM
jgi:hypothetical protein